MKEQFLSDSAEKVQADAVGAITQNLAFLDSRILLKSENEKIRRLGKLSRDMGVTETPEKRNYAFAVQTVELLNGFDFAGMEKALKEIEPDEDFTVELLEPTIETLQKLAEFTESLGGSDE